MKPGRTAAANAEELETTETEPVRRQPIERLGCWRHRQPRVVAPPIQADLLGLVDGANEQSDLNGQKLHVRQIYLDVAGDDEALVEDAVEHVDEAACLMSPQLQLGGHRGVRL